MDAKLTLTKLDASKRQLEIAIRLYFNGSDPVSIHTLTCAAYGILRDLNKQRGGSKLLMTERLMDFVKDGHKNEVRTMLSKAQNYFKHADRDHNETLKFNPKLSEFLLLEGCWKYRELTGENSPLLQLCQIWLMATHQDLFNLPAEQKAVFSMNSQELIKLGRQQFFNDLLPVVMRMNLE